MNVKPLLAKHFHFPRTPILKILIVIHAWFLWEYHAYYEWSFWKTEPLQAVGMIGYSYCSIITLYYLVETLLAPYRWRRYFGIMTLLFVYGLSVGYFFESDTFCDYNLIHDTVQNVFNWGVLEVLVQRVQYEVFIYFSIVSLWVGIQEIRRDWVSKWRVSPSNRLPQALILSILSGLLVVSPVRVNEGVTFFMQSVYQFYLAPAPVIVADSPTYPYLKNQFQYSPQPQSKPDNPHVFLIVIESFNAEAVRMKNDHGQLIMPFFNQVLNEGLYVQHYYSNSTLSIGGVGSLLYSLNPPYKSHAFQYLSDHGLTDIFKQNNYTVLGLFADKFYKEVLGKTLFPESYFIGKNTIDDATLKNNWAVEDRILYQNLFEKLDQKHRSGTLNPMFNFITTLYSHNSFSVPTARRLHYTEPSSIHEKFKNNFAVVDQGLSYFFDELRQRNYLDNSIVIIVGDHGCPIGQHGITKIETGIYDESFRVPLLIVWPNKLSPRQLTPNEGVYSHIDVAPTLVDLLGLSVNQHALQGQSMLKKQTKPQLLVQPFGGHHFQSVRYPYKYRKHISMNREFVYDLSKDPLETTSIINDIDPSLLDQFRNDIKTLFENQILLETNRIYPNTQSK